MKKLRWVFCLSLLIFALASGIIKASTLSCADVDGMAIFGYKYTGWKFIGAITNRFDSTSIANEFSAGSQFETNSINNKFGDYGSPFSSYSAFNEFASKPPIIVNGSYKLIGNLTTNDFNSSNIINSYEAMACAKKTLSSLVNNDLKNTVFRDLPSSSGGSYGSTNSQTQTELDKLAQLQADQKKLTDDYLNSLKNSSPQYSCPTHSYVSGTQCMCEAGYQTNQTKNGCDPIQMLTCPANTTLSGNMCYCNTGYSIYNGQCIDNTSYCRLKNGDHVYAIGTDCVCETGYVRGDSSCIKLVIPSATQPAPTMPQSIPTVQQPTPTVQQPQTWNELNKLAIEKSAPVLITEPKPITNTSLTPKELKKNENKTIALKESATNTLDKATNIIEEVPKPKSPISFWKRILNWLFNW